MAAANNNSLAFSAINNISTNYSSKTTTTTTFMPNINHSQLEGNIDDSMMAAFPMEYANNDFIAKMPQDCVFHPTTENYFMIFIFSIIFCLSVIGNSIVVVVILQQRSMRSVTNLYLLNLALSDLLLSVVCMPPTLVSSLVYCWVFGDILCKLLAYLQPVVVTASAYTLAAIALERYYAICRPLHSRVWHTRAHALFMISLVWFVSVLANVFMLFMYEERSYNINGLNCSPKFEPVVHFAYQIYMTIVLLLIPLFTMTVLYGNVIRTLHYGIKMDIAALELLECGEKSTNITTKKTPLWKQTSSATTNGEQSIRSTHSGQSAIVKQRLIRMLIVIVVIFFCCWTPSYIWWLLLMAQDTFGTFNIWNSKLNTLITVLTYLSSCTNPITYCFLNNKFRNALFLTFGCRSGPGSGRSNLQKAMMNNQQNGMANIIPQMQANCGGDGTPPRGAGDDRSSICSDPNNNHLGKDKKNANCCIQMFRNMKLALLANSTAKNVVRR